MFDSNNSIVKILELWYILFVIVFFLDKKKKIMIIIKNWFLEFSG